MKILTRKRIGWIFLGASVLLGVFLQLRGGGMFSYARQISPNGNTESVHVNLYVPIIAATGLCLIFWRRKIEEVKF